MTLYHGDCLDIMKQIDDKSINMILCDLPYQTTYAKWDILIPLEELWKEYERIITDDGAMIFTAVQPFTSMLVMSNGTIISDQVATRPCDIPASTTHT